MHDDSRHHTQDLHITGKEWDLLGLRTEALESRKTKPALGSQWCSSIRGKELGQAWELLQCLQQSWGRSIRPAALCVSSFQSQGGGHGRATEPGTGLGERARHQCLYI